jgi:hypothetical protein
VTYRDGHTVKITLEIGAVGLDIMCPHDGTPAGTPWDDLPHCRRSYGEDGREIREDGPLPYCNLTEFLTNYGDGVESHLDLAGVEYEVTVAPIPIEYWWSGANECYLWRPTARAGVS